LLKQKLLNSSVNGDIKIYERAISTRLLFFIADAL
jgi:hypothetical protein